MIDFLRIFEHLLPYSKAFQLTINKKLKEFIQGLSFLPSEIVNYFDLIFLDIFPSTTRQLDEWEYQFGFVNNGLDEVQRRNRLDAYWKDKGGQSPRYIQDILQSNGFDVYVHEWWEYGTESSVNIKSCTTPRNPLLYLNEDGVITFTIQCGEPLAQCGEPLAQCGQSLNPLGYVLVNKIYESVIMNFECGEPLAQCGEPLAQCGEILGYGQKLKKYTIPNDISKFPYFIYIGSQNFGDFAIINPQRKDELENLILKICPTHQWVGMLVQYT